MSAVVLLAALGLDAAVGDPDWLWRRAPHPVVVVGRLIGTLDERWNRADDAFGRRRALGIAAILVVVVITGAAGSALAIAFERMGWLGFVLEVVVVAVLLAQRSLAEHVAAVRDGLHRSIERGRRAVSMIVGRDPERLDGAGVARAAIESLAENFADGVVAPALWYLIGGLPGVLVYKAVNTADSMIGHRSERHEAFGWAAARLDDAMNWPAARISAGLIAVARPSRAFAALRTAWRDAPVHRSPNAGWPEAAMAGTLGLALGGPRSYGDGVLEEPVINAAGRRAATAQNIAEALGVLRDACVALAVLVAAIAIA